MPQDLMLVYEIATGKPSYMHSIDAAEAVGLGDYAWSAPEGTDVSDQDKAAALARSRGMISPMHAELQTPEERAEHRRQAAAAAQPVVAVPMDTPVILRSGQVQTAPPAEEKPAAQSTRPAHTTAHRTATTSSEKE